MHANTLTQNAASFVAPALNARTTEAPAPTGTRLIEAFEVTGLAVLKAAYPGLRHERKGHQIEWFMRVSRPLGAQGVALKGDLSLDCPCCDETSELLDTMAEANDPMLRRRDLDEAIADEVAFLDGRLREALGWFRNAIRTDLKAGGRDARQYLAGLAHVVSGKTIELYPVESQAKASEYKPARHVRETLQAALGQARKRPAQASAKPAAAKRPEQSKARSHLRTGRPFRMRRYSALYE